MVFKKNWPCTAAIILDFTVLQRIRKCPRADGIQKNKPATAAIILDVTILQRIHKCPRADGIKKKLARYKSNYPKLHKTPTSSQLSKSGWYLKNMSATAAIILDFTNLQRNHNFRRADGI